MASIRIVCIVHQQYSDEPYSGRGGLYASGRWHHQGRLVSYAADSLALATLEMLAGVGTLRRLREMVYVPAELDADAVWTVSPGDLPEGWDRRPPGRASRDFGDEWLRFERTVAMRVPSVLFPDEEHNYVLNPTHPDFESAVSVGGIHPLRLDPRILERLKEDDS